MRSWHQLFRLAIWCTCFTIFQPRSKATLFRRNKEFHQLINDPFQVKPEIITSANMFRWMNMKHHIKFKLWTRKNPKWAHEIVLDDVESMRSSNYDARKLTKILVHGWAHSANEVSMEDWIYALRDAYLRLADLNLIIIDYTLFAMPHMYFSAAPDMAGHRLSDFIEFLVKNGAEYSHFHMLGYSWGAHVAGIAGHRLQGKVGRITGLDPANPTFRLVENAYRLDKSDALYVDIVHTGGGPFTQGHLGLSEALGHADFYPNGGIAQPGCAFHWQKLDEEIECDHGRSVWYFVESITSPYAFLGCKCSSWDAYVQGLCPCSREDSSLMGEHAPHSSRGIFYLFTRGESPFGLGPHLNLTLQSFDEYDPEWMTYDHTNHNFTSSSAKQYLQKVMQKSITRMFNLPIRATPRAAEITENTETLLRPTETETPSIPQPQFPRFHSQLVNSVKRNVEKFQNAVARPVRQSRSSIVFSQLQLNAEA